MNQEFDFIEKVAEIVSHPEFDMWYMIQALIEKRASNSDEISILLTKVQNLLEKEG
jgi:hypothetical protein